MIIELYRGITVRPDQSSEIVTNALSKGIDGSEGWWKFQVPADIPSAQKLARKALDDSLKFESVWSGPSVAGVCACGSSDGAAFYANKHNFSLREGKTFPLLVTLRTSFDRIYVDCRDFMMPAFQQLDRESGSHVDVQRLVLKELFGETVLQYFEKCLDTDDQQERIRQGNMASFDQEVVRSHLSNVVFIEGRHNTVFKSAFFASVPQVEIVSVEECEPFSPPSSAYSIKDFISGRAI